MPWMIGRAFDTIGKRLGTFVKGGLQQMFPSYDLTATNWADLTRSRPRTTEKSNGAEAGAAQQRTTGLLNRGAARYQIIVPSYLVMFAYFLVLIVGRLFVSERRQGTMKRLRVAPLSRWQILLGKFVPAYLLSIVQGFFLLLAGKVVFGMSWGAEPLWLVPLVLTTSLSAMGLALVLAALAKTEAQVAVYGTLVVLALAGLSGCLLGDRELMPELMRRASLITPHAWALDAYRQLLANPAGPNLSIVAQSCAVLAAFGIGLILAGWALLRLEKV
jgi:ABC-type multidrug transport system permease subunit